MLFRQMKYFVSVVQNNSFTAAAEECYISQSAISQQIQALEAELGVRLLERQTRRFTLTPAGEYFYRRAKKILLQVRDAAQETAAIASGGKHTMQVGLLSTIVGQQFYEAVEEFARRYPDVELKVRIGTHEGLNRLGHEREVDLKFMDQRKAFSDSCNNFPIVEQRPCVELSCAHPLAGEKELHISQLQNLPAIIIGSREDLPDEESYFASYHYYHGRFLVAGSLQEARAYVCAGRGFLLTEGIADEVPVAICRVPIAMTRMLYCFWDKSYAAPYYQGFADILKEKYS